MMTMMVVNVDVFSAVQAPPFYLFFSVDQIRKERIITPYPPMSNNHRYGCRVEAFMKHQHVGNNTRVVASYECHNLNELTSWKCKRLNMDRVPKAL